MHICKHLEHALENTGLDSPPMRADPIGGETTSSMGGCRPSQALKGKLRKQLIGESTLQAPHRF